MGEGQVAKCPAVDRTRNVLPKMSLGPVLINITLIFSSQDILSSQCPLMGEVSLPH